MVVDATGQPISACDTVLYRVESPLQGEAGQISSPLEHQFYQESIGGRIEEDGSFRGTRWQTQGTDTSAESERAVAIDTVRAECRGGSRY